MSELLLLDVRTLAFATSVSGFLMAATMLGIYLAGMPSRALVDWSIAGLATGLGYLLGHILQTVAVPMPNWIAGTLANALIGLGHGMVLVGVQRYLGQRCWTGLVVIVVVVMFASAFVVAELRESLRWRIVLHSGVYVVFSAYAGWLLWRAERPGMGRFHRAAALVLLAFATFLGVRLGYALFSPALTTSFVQDPFQMAAFLTAMIFGFCLTMALAVMMFREKQVELLGLATKDPLTGLNNRLSLDDMAARHLALARQRNEPLSIMLLDIDHFKPVNDKYGHQVGDKVLCEVARKIDRVIRGSDTAFRFGGEEFLVLLPGANAVQAAQVAERLRAAIGNEPVVVDGSRLSLTASFGVVECRVDEESWDGSLRRADEALYQAKRAGRNRVMPVPLALVVPA